MALTINKKLIFLFKIVALLSFFVWTESATSVSRHEKEIQILDEKRTTVLELTAAATAASAAATLLPDDTGTPINSDCCYVFFIWIIKSILGVNLDITRFSRRTKQNKIEQNM